MSRPTNNNDIDGDGVANASDNCGSVPNTSQANADADTFGDACDADSGNGGGTTAAQSSTGGDTPMTAAPGVGVKVGELSLTNTSASAHEVKAVTLTLDNPQNVARIWGVANGVHFACGPATPAASNTCTPASAVSLQPGQALKLEVWVELKPTTVAMSGEIAMAGLGTGGALMLMGLFGAGRRRRERIATALLVTAVLTLTACGGGGGDSAPPQVIDKSITTVTATDVTITDENNAPVDYGLPTQGVEIGKVKAGN